MVSFQQTPANWLLHQLKESLPSLGYLCQIKLFCEKIRIQFLIVLRSKYPFFIGKRTLDNTLCFFTPSRHGDHSKQTSTFWSGKGPLHNTVMDGNFKFKSRIFFWHKYFIWEIGTFEKRFAVSEKSHLYPPSNSIASFQPYQTLENCSMTPILNTYILLMFTYFNW